MFKLIVILLFFYLVNYSSATIASYDYAVITTQQKAKVVMRQLKPLFAETAIFSENGAYQLIIKASPATIKEINHVIKQIDKPVQNLLISIASYQSIKALNAANNKQSYAISNSQSYHKPGRGNVKTITTTRRQSDRQQNKIYSGRVIEGEWVYIYTGEEFSYPSNRFGFVGNNYYKTQDKLSEKHNTKPYALPIASETQYKEVESGFSAKAILKNNNQVVVDIRAEINQRNKNYQKNITTSATNSMISGHLNEWIKLGSINQMRQQKSTISTQNNREKKAIYYIKVETIN